MRHKEREDQTVRRERGIWVVHRLGGWMGAREMWRKRPEGMRHGGGGERREKNSWKVGWRRKKRENARPSFIPVKVIQTELKLRDREDGEQTKVRTVHSKAHGEKGRERPTHRRKKSFAATNSVAMATIWHHGRQGCYITVSSSILDYTHETCTQRGSADACSGNQQHTVLTGSVAAEMKLKFHNSGFIYNLRFLDTELPL